MRWVEFLQRFVYHTRRREAYYAASPRDRTPAQLWLQLMHTMTERVQPAREPVPLIACRSPPHRGLSHSGRLSLTLGAWLRLSLTLGAWLRLSLTLGAWLPHRRRPCERLSHSGLAPATAAGSREGLPDELLLEAHRGARRRQRAAADCPRLHRRAPSGGRAVGPRARAGGAAARGTSACPSTCGAATAVAPGAACSSTCAAATAVAPGAACPYTCAAATAGGTAVAPRAARHAGGPDSQSAADPQRGSGRPTPSLIRALRVARPRPALQRCVAGTQPRNGRNLRGRSIDGNW
eukprot:1857991-Prymnesium_polylepis.1